MDRRPRWPNPICRISRQGDFRGTVEDVRRSGKLDALAYRATLPAMSIAAATADRKVKRTALAREARRLADEAESLYIELEQAGALAKIRRYMIVHSEGVPQFNLLDAAKALRCYAGVLSMIAGATARPAPVPDKNPVLRVGP
jgi:hypothetical protein